MKTSTLILVGSVVAAIACWSAWASDYTFIRIADTNGPFSNFASVVGPAINDADVVAFAATLDTGTDGIFRSNGSGYTTIATVTGPIRALPPVPMQINQSGTVVFRALVNGEQFIYTGSGGPLTPIIDTTGPLAYFVGGPIINDAGNVAIKAGFGNSGPPAQILRIANGISTTIAEAFDFDAPTSLNERGTVVFHSGNVNGGHAILAGNGLSLTVIADNSDGFSIYGGEPSINDGGTIVFTAYDGAEMSIYRAQGGTITPVMISSGSLWLHGNAATINNGGVVAFGGQTPGGHGIYTGTDPTADKVIREGDALDGSTLAEFAFDSGGFNNRGRVAFYGLLADGRKGIYVAEPVCHGDATHDDVVNIDDLVIVISLWGHPDLAGGIADVTHDGLVNIDDLVSVITHWGSCL